MKERPILFSGPMVRAILEGRKTQTRRVVKPHAPWGNVHTVGGPMAGRTDAFWYHYPETDRVGHLVECPYGVPGDRLIVKEATWQWCRKVPNGKTKTGRPKYRYLLHGTVDTGSVIYAADHPQKPLRTTYAEPGMVWHYKHARFMQKHLSRLTLEITDVRVQRVQEISEEDAEAEGIVNWGHRDGEPWNHWRVADTRIEEDSPLPCFEQLWDSINFARGYGWDAKPWVWALTFKRIDYPLLTPCYFTHLVHLGNYQRLWK